MRTNSGLWQIENETRYSTEDILALMNAYEEVIKQQGELAAAQELPPGVVGVVRFRDYSPACAEVERREWEDGAYTVYKQRNFVRGAIWGCPSERVHGLIKPSLLYASPLEALAAVGSDGCERAPEGFSRALLAEVIRYLYANVANWGLYHQVTITQEVRINAKREMKKSNKPVKGLVIRQLRSRFYPPLNGVGQAVLNLDTLLKSFDELKREAASIDLDVPVEHADIEAAISAATRVMEGLQQTYDKLHSYS